MPSEDCPLEQAHGRILREAVVAERDLPPYDRVTLDGIAVSSEALARGRDEFEVAGTQPAGVIPIPLPGPESCVEVMTGAVLPPGSDCVVPYEAIALAAGRARLTEKLEIGPGHGVHPRGSDARAGATLLATGRRLSGREVAVAASCGRPVLKVSLIPSIAVLATGDELVELSAPVAAHQVRRSNDYALRASLLLAGYARVDRYHLRDARHEIAHILRKTIAEYDVIVLCGGVSKGKYDFLPSVLNELTVKQAFHGVRQRPGKPFWYGITPRQTPLFALPGNPVSAFTCLHRYVLPGLERLMLATPPPPRWVPLAEPFAFRPPLTCFLPVNLRGGPEGSLAAVPTPTNSSGDFSSLAGTDGFLELPEEQQSFPAGFPARFFSWR